MRTARQRAATGKPQLLRRWQSRLHGSCAALNLPEATDSMTVMTRVLSPRTVSFCGSDAGQPRELEPSPDPRGPLPGDGKLEPCSGSQRVPGSALSARGRYGKNETALRVGLISEGPSPAGHDDGRCRFPVQCNKSACNQTFAKLPRQVVHRLFHFFCAQLSPNFPVTGRLQRNGGIRLRLHRSDRSAQAGTASLRTSSTSSQNRSSRSACHQ
ncbi:hypothetical protein B0G71_7973 [Paraburkholderia sp. BL27I4N3]|nr:hypothetical protein B0G71_7973 [Paraburkholderia sp. BL27I4N3]